MNVQLNSPCKRTNIAFWGNEPEGGLGGSPPYEQAFTNEIFMVIPATTHKLSTIRGVMLRDPNGAVINGGVVIANNGTVTIDFSLMQSGTLTIY